MIKRTIGKNDQNNDEKNHEKNDQKNNWEEWSEQWWEEKGRIHGWNSSIQTQARELPVSILPCNQIETRRTAIDAQPLKAYVPGGEETVLVMPV